MSDGMTAPTRKFGTPSGGRRPLTLSQVRILGIKAGYTPQMADKALRMGARASAAKEAMGDRASAAKEAMGDRASAAKEAMGERAAAAKDAMGERATAAKDAMGERATAA